MMQAQDIRELLLTHYHIRGDITTLDSEWGGTFRITAPGGESYLLKIAPGSVKNARTLMEISVIDKLDKCQLPVAIPRIIRTVTSTTYIETDHGIARLYNWIEGRLWNELNPKSPAALYSLGSGIGYLHKCLMPLDYEAAHDEFLWSPECAMQIQAASLKIDPAKKLWLDAAVKRYTGAHSIIGSLRHCLNYNDANDFNIIVSDDRDDPHVKGFIDFGDLISGPSVLDLAVCIAYATLDLPDPVGAAAEVVKGYNSVLPLSEDEIEAIVPLASARLALSVYHAYHRILTDPSNDYWQVSSEPAWRLLEKLYHTDDYLALCRIREACGMEPSPQNKSLTGWLKSNYSDIYPITGSDLSSVDVKIMDWSVGSPELGGLDSLNNVPEMTRDTFMNIEEAGAFAGIGRYDEPRIVYTTPAYELEGNNGPEMRTIHIGIDIFLPPGSPLYAPLDGIIHTITDNAGPKEYGPLIILQHKIEEENLIFYTLYGHNSRACLNWHKEGDIVKKGDKIAEIGDYPENGGWVPHVHFQIMSDLLGYRNDYPGVALASQRKVWLSICPDPNLMLGIGNAALQVAPRSTKRILQRRRNLLGANLGVSYSSPLHIVRGWKTRLFSADGTAYLDTVNNISHVGHEHPRIVAAASRQSAVLNTNTRYLHTAILDLAEELLATLPDQFTRMYFVNSGSEANDLALRVARHFTGTPQTLVMHEAYHGITQSCLDVSPHKFLGSGGSGRPG